MIVRVFIVLSALFGLGIFALSHARAESLESLAQGHAYDLARASSGRCTYASLNHDGFFSHRGPAGARAENVGCGAKTEARMIASWWRSPGHARNMRLPGPKVVAHAASRSGVLYWVMEIGQ